ncbi:SRPBCC family protein [Salinibacterium hongtaonis]|uniref:SRPBCC family protein n=1 Tax=Homoserinimonas hongtaonis TaxID=2079791 RepID=A0A2U1T0Y6_9MICO|nr:SRPBCC family protein [Salinibacterium hongtaonis]AWB90062.1 hypothetical protein C2138_11360 [Salinibacterium hongtaonis]PWB97517.1 SRPBCC family protein [Salinibacterium hongtaonis]
MVQIRDSIDIQAPPSEVYAALRDLAVYPSWLTHSVVYRGTKVTASASGLSYEDSTMVGRMHGELVEDVPDHALHFHQHLSSGGLDAHIRYSLDATGTATHLTRVGDMTTKGVLHMMQPMLVRMAAAESKRMMGALKARVEHHA